MVLARAPLVHHDEADWDSESPTASPDVPAVAAVAYHRRGGGLVRNAGTTDWPRHLHHPCVDRFTRNVLDAVGVGSPDHERESPA